MLIFILVVITFLQVWAAEWVGVWGRLVNCSYWDTHWMYLVARAVKDDWKGERGLIEGGSGGCGGVAVDGRVC